VLRKNSIRARKTMEMQSFVSFISCRLIAAIMDIFLDGLYFDQDNRAAK